MLLDRFTLAEAAAFGDPEAHIAPISINNDPGISCRSPYEYIYARYDRRPDLQVQRRVTRIYMQSTRQKRAVDIHITRVGGLALVFGNTTSPTAYYSGNNSI